MGRGRGSREAGAEDAAVGAGSQAGRAECWDEEDRGMRTERREPMGGAYSARPRRGLQPGLLEQ